MLSTILSTKIISFFENSQKIHFSPPKNIISQNTEITQTPLSIFFLNNEIKNIFYNYSASQLMQTPNNQMIDNNNQMITITK